MMSVRCSCRAAAAGIVAGGSGTSIVSLFLFFLLMVVVLANASDSAAAAPHLLQISAEPTTIESIVPSHVVRGSKMVLLSIRVDNLGSLVENDTIVTPNEQEQWSCWFGADRDHRVDAQLIANSEVQCWWNMMDSYGSKNNNGSTIEIPIAISASAGDDGEDGAILSSTFNLTVVEPIVAVSAFPLLGPTTGSTPVLVELQETQEMGDNHNAEIALACLFGDVRVSASRLNSTHIECCSPTRTRAGRAQLSILYDDDAVFDSWITAVDRHTWFEYYEQPVLGLLSPSACTEMTNTTLTIHASSFEDSHSYSCRFGSGLDAVVVPAQLSLLAVQPSAIQCTTPRLRPGSPVAVEISANGGIDYTSSGLALTVYPRFTVLSTYPNEGPMRGGMNLTVVGTNFRRNDSGMFCHFGIAAVAENIRIEATIISLNELSCRIPPSPFSGTVLIEICWGNRLECVAEGSFSYREELRILNVFPRSGPDVGGTDVRIELDRPFPPELQCRFGSGTDALYSPLGRIDRTSVGYCKSPANQNTSIDASTSTAFQSIVDLTVAGGGYDSALGTVSFEYVPPISLTEVAPRNIPEVEAGIVRVVGENFPDVEGLACLVGNSTSSDPANLFLATWKSVTEIECDISDPGHVPGSYPLYIVYGDHLSSSRSTNALSIKVDPAISVANIIPVAGPPGTMVMVYGTNLASSPSMSCRFGSTIVPADSIINASCIRCLVPAVGEDDVTLEGSIPLFVSSNNVHFPDETPQLFFTYTGDPTIDSVDPDTVDVSRTDVVVAINGTEFHPFVDSDTFCRLAETNISTLAVLSSDRHASCEFESMPTEPGIYTLALQNVHQMSFCPARNIHVVPTPMLSALDPSWLLTRTRTMVGNNTVLIRGANFTDSTSLSCTVAGNDTDESFFLPAEWVSSSSVRCALPLSLRRGTYILRVSNDGFVASSTFVGLQVYDPVQLHSLSPSKGGPGTLIAVRGRDFIPGLICVFAEAHDDSKTTVLYSESQFVNSTYIQCSALELGEWFGRMEVDVRLDQISMSIGPRIHFDYVDLRVQSIHPSLGSSGGGTLVTINLGQNHFSDAVSNCRFGESIVKASVASGKDEVQCLSPPSVKGAVGPASIALSANGVDFVASHIEFEYLSDPIVDEIKPLHGLESGGTQLFLRGRQFTNVSSLECRFFLVEETHDSAAHPTTNGSSVTVGGEWISTEAMHCITPNLYPGNYSVELSTNGQDYVQTGFRFCAEPMVTISAMSPKIARAGGGSLITIVGTNFASNVVCSFDGDIERASILRNSNEIQCLSPQRDETSIGSYVNLSISNNGKDFVAAPALVLIYDDLRTEAFLPLSGSTKGGTLVVVRGGNFANLSSPIHCAFGDHEVEASIDSANLLFCRTPSVSVAANVSLSIVYGSDRYSIPNASFQYKDDVKIIRLSPTSLPANVNTTITVSGGPFRSSSLLCCRLGDLPPYPATHVDSERVQCRLPRDIRPGSYPLSVANNCLDFAPNPPMVQVLTPIQVLAVSPPRGFCEGGSAIHISGTNFASLEIERLSCQIGERYIVPAKERNSSHLLCTVPPRRIPGPVLVQVLVDGVPPDPNPSLSFEYIDMAVTLFSPASGRISGGTPVVVKLEQAHPANVISHCRFGDVVVKAAVGSTGSDNEVSCMSPSLPKGKGTVVPVALGLDSVHFSSSQNLYFEYLPYPTIDRLGPAMGPEVGGTEITLSGNYIANSIHLGCRFTQVAEGGDAGWRRRSSVIVDGNWISLNTMRCITPRLFPGEYQVRMMVSADGNGVDDDIDAGTFFVYPQVSIEKIDPVGGPVQGGTNITVVGGPFQSSFDLTCKFGDSVTSAIYHNSSKISCLSPRPMSTVRIGPTNFSVSANGVDFSEPHSFTYYISPIIRELGPSQGVADESTVVIIRGANFNALSPSSVLCEFGTLMSEGAVLSVDKLRCEAPALPEGKVQVRISLNSGVDWSSPFKDGFAYKEPGSIFSLSPSSGPWTGGTEVRVLGDHFVQSDTLCCRVGDSVAQTIWISENEVYCVTPRQKPGPYAVTVLNDCNSSASALTTTMIFEYYSLPITSSLSPSSGPSCGGTKIRVGGRHFSPGTDGLFCMFGGSLRSEATLASDSRHVECYSPPKSHVNQLDAVNVTVGDLSGVYHSEIDLWFSYADEHTHSEGEIDALFGNASHITFHEIVPNLGMTSGGTKITVRGIHFEQRHRYQVVFGSDAMVDAKWRSDTEIFCVSPPSPSFGEVRVTIIIDGLSTVATNHTFNYLKPVSLSEVSPSRGPVEGGTIVNVFGTNFIDLPLLSCRFEGITVPAEFISPNSLKCKTPAGVYGSAFVGVSVDGSTFYPGGAGRQGGVDAITFTYEHLPSIDHIFPSNIPVGQSSNITIYGDHLDSSSNIACRFGEVSVVPAYRLGDDQVSCIAPASPLGEVDIRVSSNRVDWSLEKVLLSYIQEATISRITPVTVQEGAETALLVEGTGFLDSQNISCHFGGGGSFTVATWHSPTTLQCRTPELDLRFAPGGRIDFSVSNNGGVHLSESVPLQVSARVSVLSMSPSSGYKGQHVVIKTNHLQRKENGAMCMWADDDQGVPAISGSSHHEIICTVPNQLVDAVALRIAAPGIAPMDVGIFTLLPNPIIDTLHPVHGPVSGGTNVKVAGQHLSNITDCVFEISSRRNESSGDRRLVLPAVALSSDEVTCITPEVTHQTVAMVSLTTSVGGGHTTRGLVFTFRHPPRLLTSHPHVGSTNTTVTLTGSGFHDTPELGCRFDGLGEGEGTVVPARFVSSLRILCQAPSYSVGDATVAVSTNGKDFGTAVPFRFVAPMAMHSISPRIGGVSGGTAVRITATNVENTGSLSCKFGDTFVKATYLDQNSLLCISPRVSVPSEVEISVTMNGKDSAAGLSNNTRFTFVHNPKIIDITPNKGFFDGGQELRLRTENVYHDPDSALYCAFGKKRLVEAVRHNSTLVQCTSPAHQPDRPISVDVSLVYEHTYLETHGGPSFSYISGAIIASVEPAAGSSLGGTRVEITGIGFLNLNDLVCVFGDAISPARFIDEARVTCQSPATRVAGKMEVKVESSTGSLQTRDTLARFEYYFPISLYSIDPSIGVIRGGTRVKVSGAGFSKAHSHGARCQYGNIDVPAQYISEQELWCISPSLADTTSRSAVVSFGVSMNGGIDWEYGRDEKVTFEYVAIFHIERVSPPSGPSAGGTSVEIEFSSGNVLLSVDEYMCHFGDVVVGARAISDDTIECISPQHEEGSLFLEVSRDGGDITEDRQTFTYYQQPVIESLEPPHGYARLGQTVRVLGYGFGLTRPSDRISCRFNKRIISDARWVSSREIICDAPSIDPTVHPRQVSMAIAMNAIDFTGDNSTTFTYMDEPSGVAIDPSVVSADGGTVVTLEGKNFEKALRCRFGSLGAPSPVLSATRNSLTCKAPAILPTSPYLGQSTRMYLEFGGLGFHSIGQHVYYEPHVSRDYLYRMSLNDTHSIPLVNSIEPNLIGSNGGTSVRVVGGRFVNSGGLACRFDSVVVPARFISPRVVQCLTPRMPPGIVMVDVVNGGPGQLVSKKGALVTVLADVSLNSIEPDFGPLRGGTLVDIGGTFPPKCEAVVCKFGSTGVHAFDVSGGVVSCISPPVASRSPETVKVQVSCNEGEHFSESFATFSYSSPAEVTGLVPSHGGVEGGTQVLVQGDHFQDSSRLACMFGSDSITKATFISRNQMLCVSPPWKSVAPASVNLEVTINGQDYSQSLQKFEYRPKPVIDSIWPNGGPTIGSTEVFITGLHCQDEVQLACSFDGIVTEGTYIDNRTLSCHSPPHLPGIVSLRVVGDVYAGDTSYQSDPMDFLYYNPPSIAFTTPRRGSALGGTPIIFTGTNLFNTTALRCRFGKNEVRGAFISGRNALCISPPSTDNSAILAVPVTVSLNGKDFSPENGVAYEYHSGSMAGHYSGPSAIEWNTPAPNGTYAEAGSVNFTLCDPGGFQPKAGQSSCLTCPIGFICPGFGLSKPLLCPVGGVCDRAGLSAPSALCPRGHWCGAGVKTYEYNTLMDKNEDLGILQAVHRLWKKSIDGIGNVKMPVPIDVDQQEEH